MTLSSFDRRGDIVTTRLFIRSQPYMVQTQTSKVAWTFDQTDTVDIGIDAGTQLPYNTQRFPLVENEDLNVKDRDGNDVTDAVITAATAFGQKYSDQGDGPVIEYLLRHHLLTPLVILRIVGWSVQLR